MYDSLPRERQVFSFALVDAQFCHHFRSIIMLCWYYFCHFWCIKFILLIIQTLILIHVPVFELCLILPYFSINYHLIWYIHIKLTFFKTIGHIVLLTQVVVLIRTLILMLIHIRMTIQPRSHLKNHLFSYLNALNIPIETWVLFPTRKTWFVIFCL